MAASRLDDEDWQALGKHLSEYDERRETVIKRCRDSQKLAKMAIYSLHRGDFVKADQQLQQTEAIAQELAPLLLQHPGLRYGSYAATMEEWAEAMAFKVWLKEGRLLAAKEIPSAEPEEYLGGILDMTGELNRWAIAKATLRDRASVQRARDLVDALMGRFLQFDLRNGALRKKFDTLKYILKKLESTLYELSLTDALGLVLERGEGGQPGQPEDAALDASGD